MPSAATSRIGIKAMENKAGRFDTAALVQEYSGMTDDVPLRIPIAIEPANL